jgi:IS5 family transposase
MAKLLHGQEREVFGDEAYWNESHRRDAKRMGIRYRINRRLNGREPLSEHQRRVNRLRSREPGPGASTSFPWSSACGASTR